MTTSRRSVAVVGSSVAGRTAAYVLSARDRVTLFEADDRLGGHAHTHYLDPGGGSTEHFMTPLVALGAANRLGAQWSQATEQAKEPVAC